MHPLEKILEKMMLFVNKQLAPIEETFKFETSIDDNMTTMNMVMLWSQTKRRKLTTKIIILEKNDKQVEEKIIVMKD